MVDFAGIGKVARTVVEDTGALKEGGVLKEAGDAAMRMVQEVTGAPKAVAKEIATGPAKTFDTGEAIPDVLRPYLRSDSVFDAQRMSGIGDKYREGMDKLFALPREHWALYGDTAPKVAEQIMNGRAAITGERFTPASLAKEVTRLDGLNPGLSGLEDTGLKKIVAYTDQSLADIARDALVYRHVPPIGQFYKAATNERIADADLDAAFNYQKTLASDAPRRFLGEILEDQGKLSPAENNAAFGTQKDLKAYLAAIFKEVHPELAK